MKFVVGAALTMATLFSLGSCSSTSQSLLQESDLPRVTNTTDYGESNGTNTVCGTLNGLESNLSATEPESVGTQFTLEGNDRVISSLLGIYVAESSVDYTINRIDRAIDLCLADPADTDEFERIAGLPEGAVGFRSVLTSSSGPVTTERAYAVADDEHVVVVTVEHTGEGEAATTVADLLPIAIDRAVG